MLAESRTDRPRAVLIAGPTASGKSALALDLAWAAGGVVINADSMQVYADLRIITARPTPEEEALAPHRLYGHVDGAAEYSVAAWLAEAAQAIAEAEAAGRLPILIGGTGLYFKALTLGLAEVPPIPEAVRLRVRGAAEGVPAPELYARLAYLDPLTAARLRPSDPQRIIRALEVIEATGRPLADWQARPGTPPVINPLQCLKIFLSVDRGALRERIARRFEAMLAAGALDEVRRLDARGLDPARPILKAHGVPGLRRHLAGEITLDEAAAGGVLDTRRYAKRQETWFRHQFTGWEHLAPEAAAERLRGAFA
ncbi:tRNA (adenosine(37)-N6)-dimethylallyltransferase MiaA [Ancylobacter terrae]|uniref:tRNA (adenosine(37)-N6)-dimethylallyltransferase MiaA n=1 Tax=Ancylobacter sp. sgz301288 TaxID=3342077 RepID=UPI00385AC995